MTRAARIAHTTPAGQIYVSQEFAALCGEEGLDTVSLEYLGPLPTSQLFNDTPLYRLHRAPVKRITP
jgi:class 3 adenylate cyclase